MVVRRAVAQRYLNCHIGPQIVAQKQTHAAAGGGERKTVAIVKSVIPGSPCIGEAVELITGEVFVVKLLVEAQFKRTGEPVVAANHATAMAAPERTAPR